MVYSILAFVLCVEGFLVVQVVFKCFHGFVPLFLAQLVLLV